LTNFSLRGEPTLGSGLILLPQSKNTASRKAGWTN
jgi:hypothetical protein